MCDMCCSTVFGEMNSVCAMSPLRAPWVARRATSHSRLVSPAKGEPFATARAGETLWTPSARRRRLTRAASEEAPSSAARRAAALRASIAPARSPSASRSPRATSVHSSSRPVPAAAAASRNSLNSSTAAAGTGLDQLWTLVDLGDLLALGDRAGAIDALRAAARLAAELGASSEAALVKRRLRALGVHGVSPARAGANGSPFAGLTRREWEVARLATQGARNGDIAQTLFISPKTVEQHMSHIYLKLGVRNRAELSSRYGAQLIAATGAART